MQRLGRCAVRSCFSHLTRCHRRSHPQLGWHPRKQFGSAVALRDDDNKFVVRHFEQVGPRETDLREVKEEEQERLSARLAQLENALERIQSIEDADKEIASSKDFEVRFQLPKDLYSHIKQFNRLVNAYRSPDLLTNKEEVTAKALWKQYLRCKEWVPTFLEQIPDPVWSLLWEINYQAPQASESRARRLWTLADDMTQVKKELSPAQRMVRIESRFSCGEYDKALRWWNSERTELEDKEEVASEFRELGIRTAIMAGKPKLATELARGSRFQLKAQHVIPLIADRLAKGDETNAQIAWALYLDLRLRMGDDITLEDFDKVVMCFLDSGRPDLALVAFKDLVLFKTKSNDDSVKLLEKSQSLYKELQNRSNNLEDLTHVSLTALAYLPRRLANSYFFGSWIKRLIGMGRTDSVGPVLQLMFERGISPGAKHINGFMSALLRGGDGKDKEVATQIGWSMIRERLRFVARRRGAGSGQIPKALDDPDPGLLVPPYLSRNLPSATIETFCILLLHYERANMQHSVGMLKQALLAAEIPPDCFFMNHLIYTELLRGNLEAAWNIFDKRKGVQPDLETFAALWDCERKLLGIRGQYTGDGFPAPRALFSTMMNWQSSLTGRARQTTLEEFSQDLYLQIIRCLCYHRDPGGTLVALYALKETFNAYPDDAAVRLITIQMARLGEKKTSQKRRRVRFFEVQDNKARLDKVTEAMEAITERRTEELRVQGVDPEKLLEEQRREEVLYRTAMLLRTFIRHHEGLELDEESNKEKVLENIAWEMGTGALHMEPPLYLGPPAVVSEPEQRPDIQEHASIVAN